MNIHSRIFSIGALASALFVVAPTPLHAQSSKVHGAIWTSGDIFYVDAGLGTDTTRSGNPTQGKSLGAAYRTVQFAVQDILGTSPTFPIVVNVSDFALTAQVHTVQSLNLPARGLKLQTFGNPGIVLDGNNMSVPVLFVGTTGPDWMPDGTRMPDSIIQGFTIQHGGHGIQLAVQTPSADVTTPLRTEIRDCEIKENWGGSGLGGNGIFIDSFAAVPTEYVIESNRIHGNGEPNLSGVASRGVWIQGRPSAHDSTLIRGNQIYRQETGIQMSGFVEPKDTWIRPRIQSNLLWDHEQHVWAVNSGPLFYNNTVYRTHDYCDGPDRRIVHHIAPTIPANAVPENERFGFAVRNCVFEHSVQPIEPYGPPSGITWPIATFSGTGTIVVSNTDFEPSTALQIVDLRQGAGNNRPVATPLFVSLAAPDIHLQPNATQVESGSFADVQPGLLMTLGTSFLPCDVRTDVDGDVRHIDRNRDTMFVTDRGGDEVYGNAAFGMRLTTDADRTGGVTYGSPVTFTVQGIPGDLAAIQSWWDCSTDPFDDVVYNNAFLPPVGTVLLPFCDQINGNVLVLDAAGRATVTIPSVTGLLESQFYFQAVGITPAGNPVPGTSSNRVRIEID